MTTAAEIQTDKNTFFEMPRVNQHSTGTSHKNRNWRIHRIVLDEIENMLKIKSKRNAWLKAIFARSRNGD